MIEESATPVNRPEERGAVLILLALMVFVIIAFLALSVDTTLISASRVHSQLASNTAVMGALEAFGSRLTAGRTQAQALTDANGALAVAEAKLSANFNSKNPGWFTQRVSGNTQGDLEICPAMGANGCLRPVQFYFPIPQGGICPSPTPWTLATNDPNWRPCACDVSCECGENCPNDPQVTGVPANGLKLRYNIDSNSPIRGIFRTIANVAQGGSPAEVTYGFTARAVLTPRNAIFLLDLSDSMTRGPTAPPNFYATNQNPTFPGCGFPPYSYAVNPGSVCNMNGTTLMNGFTALGVNASSEKNRYANCVYRAPDNAGGPPGPGETTANYSCVQFDATFPTQIQGLADRYDGVIVNTTYAPEPLTSSLNGVNQAMQEFVARRVPNDRIGIVGFDHERVLNRILAQNMASDLTIEPVQIDTTPGSLFDQFLQATNGGGFPLTTSAKWNKYLFPRRFDSIGTKYAVYSDLPEALILARRMIFNTPNFRTAQNLVVMFSDGLTNCYAPGTVGPAGTRCGDENSWGNAYFNNSLPLVEAELNNNYRTNRITFDMFMLDSGTMPHELMWNMSGRCATIDEARSLGMPVVDTTGSVFYQVNRLFDAVAATGGMWAPIRDCRRSGGVCSPITTTTLNTACAGINNAAVKASLGAAISGSGNVVNGSSGTEYPASPYWDSRGRVSYDVLNRTPSQQVSDYMNQILAKPPFVLQSPSCRWPTDMSTAAELPACF